MRASVPFRCLRGLLLAATAGLLLLPALGCESLDPLSRRSDFKETQKRFSQYVRYGALTKASKYVVKDMRKEFLELAPDISQVRFTDYEVIDVDIAPGVQSATVEVRYSGYLMTSPVERSLQVTQEWAKDDTTGEWQVRLELAAIRDALGMTQP